VQTYEEGVGCRAWILGKWMEPKKIQAPAWWTTKFLAVFLFFF
jgi:hypothetical protein